MHWTEALLLLIGGVSALLVLGAPVAFAFIAVNVVGAYFFLGGDVGLLQLARNMVNSVSNFAFTPIPMFLLMGDVLFHTGLAIKAIDAVALLINRMPGRLAVIALVAGTIFSAISGSTIATTAMLGSLLLPEMLKRGYDRKIAMGPIMAIGGVDMLIPPSGLAVLLGGLAGIPISALLVAGVVPGLILSAVFIGYIVLRTWLDPALAPAVAAPTVSLWERWKPFLAHVVPLAVIIGLVIGSMLLGWATPTESAAVGCVATGVLAAAFGQLTWRAVKEAMSGTAADGFGRLATATIKAKPDVGGPAALPGQVPSYHAEGYLYAINVPASSTKVSIYDPGYCPDGAGAIDKKLIAADSVVPLQFVLRSPDTAGTPNDYSDDPVFASGSYSDCTGALTWVDVATVTTAGRYALEIKTPSQANSLGANLFALRATASTTNLCDARINGAGCPQVSGLSAMSIMATVGSGSARFSFAEIAAGYAGKQMVIGMWDPGEGMNSIQVLDPAGNPVSFRVRVTPSLGGGTPAFAATAVNTLDVSGCGVAYTQPGPNRAGNCIYNDRLVELLVQIPSTYTGGWWSVVYAGGTTPTDRTTWSIRIVGDPVHLARA